MAQSPIHNELDLPTFQILVDGKTVSQDIFIEKIEIEKEVNKVSKALITILDGDPIKEDFAVSDSKTFDPGKKIKIKLGYHNVEEDVFEGYITSHDIRYKNGRGSNLLIKCHDEAYKLSLTKNHNLFTDKKDSDVISQIIGNHGLSKTVTASNYKHSSLVQHECSDWDFIKYRADANGFILLNDAGKLEVKPPSFSESPVLNLKHGTSVFSFHGQIDAKSQINSISLSSWDGNKHTVNKETSSEPSDSLNGNLKGKTLSSTVGSPKIDLKLSTPEDSTLLKKWADSNLQRVRLFRNKTTISFPGVSTVNPGKTIEIEGFGNNFNGKAYVSSVYHEFSDSEWVTTIKTGLDTNEFLDPSKINTPDALGLLPKKSGLHIGLVKKIDKDPDGEFRISVELPSLSSESKLVWARFTSPYGSSAAGFYFMPEIGDEVVLSFLNNDPRYAVIIGSLYGKKNKPPFTPEEKNKDKAIVTKSGLKLIFEEEKKAVTIETPGGQKVTLDDDAKHLVLEDQNSNKLTLDNKGITLNSGKDITLKAKGSIKIDSTSNTDINSKANVSLAGNNVNAKGKIAFKAEGAASAEVKSSGTMTVKGAMVMIN